MKNRQKLMNLAASLLAAVAGCAAFGPLPPAQAHLGRAEGGPAVFLGEGANARPSNCQARDAEVPSQHTAAMEIRLNLTCRLIGSGEPPWRIRVVATCAGGDGKDPCVDSGTWTLAFTGSPDGENAVRDLGTATLDAPAFVRLRQSYEPQSAKTATSTPEGERQPR